MTIMTPTSTHLHPRALTCQEEKAEESSNTCIFQHKENDSKEDQESKRSIIANSHAKDIKNCLSAQTYQGQSLSSVSREEDQVQRSQARVQSMPQRALDVSVQGRWREKAIEKWLHQLQGSSAEVYRRKTRLRSLYPPR